MAELHCGNDAFACHLEYNLGMPAQDASCFLRLDIRCATDWNSGIAGYGKWLEKANLIASRIRQLGVQRVLYGSDSKGQGNLVPREGWAAFLQLPLSEDEFETIRNNIAPYIR